MALIAALLLSLLPAISVSAATARITINEPSYVSETQPDTSNPNVPRATALPYTIRATIENISDSQIPELYYEITNMTTTKTPVVEKLNKAIKTGPFDIVFNNVQLTDGLNRIVVKLGESNVVASAPAWVYFTSTTSITNLNVNGVPFVDGKIYPENPSQSTLINISGTAPNASEVRVYLEGDPQPKNAFLNNGEFFFLADDINNTQSTANLKLRPGDNPMTIMAVNNSKTFQTSKNLIYDNGLPFAFNAKIKEQSSTTEKDLIKSPAVSSPNVTISALLKDDLTGLGTLQYNYLEVLVGGQKFGPYNLSGATVAPKATSVSPTILADGHSASHLIVIGESLGSATGLELRDKTGAATTINTVSYVNSAGTVAIFPLTSSLTSSNSPYSVVVKSNTQDLNEPFTITVGAATGLPQIVSTSISDNVSGTPTVVGKAGAALAPLTVELNSPVPVGDLSLSITDYQGNSVATSTGSGTNPYSFPLPIIQTEGLYKYKLYYKGSVLTERAFQVDRRDPADPNLTISGATSVTQSASPTTLYLMGTNLGTIPGDYTGVQLVNLADNTNTVSATVHEVRDNAILLTIPDQSAFVPGARYKIVFDKAPRYPDGTAGTPKHYEFGTVTNSVYVQTAVPAATISGVTIPQVRPTELNTLQVSVNGTGLTGPLTAVITNEDGGLPRNANIVSATGTAATVDFSNISNLPAGNYFLRISHNNIVIGQYPFSIVDPLPGGFSVLSDGASGMLVTGSNFGHNQFKGDYKLRFSPSNNPSQYTDVLADKLEAGSKMYFTKPGTLAGGSYQIQLLYKDQPVGNAFSYTLSGTPSKLSENSTWSKPGRYKVFDFSADLTISADRNQVVQFRFFNLATDNIPATTFYFSYVDPNLPYLEYVETNGVRLSETALNAITELPASFKIYANKNTNKINVYYGDFLSSNLPSETITAMDATNPNYNVFTLNLPQTTPNGLTKITFVPGSNANPDKTGENLSGKKQYDLNINNSPYVILNNLYNGLVVKNPTAEIVCNRGGAPTGACVSGRLVNTPAPPFDAQNYVEIYVNEIKNDSFQPEADPMSFTFVLGALNEGRNKIKFNIYINGSLVASSEYDLFQFSTEAPDFLSIKPIESSDVKKYVPTSQPDTYATNESTVAFSGQFANGTDIKLTVRMHDENNVPVVKYDRRYGSNFGSADPASGNPNFFRSISASTGQFETYPITLMPKGQTIFEFSITNSSGVTVTRTIAVNREPLPYVVISPKLTKSANGEYSATINSNYQEIVLEAEGATSVTFGKVEAVEREVVDGGMKKKRFYFEATDLKAGKNTIKFTVIRGTEKVNGSFVLNNVNAAAVGAQFKTPLKQTITAFNGEVTLKFPKGTNFVRNDPSAANTFLTSDRKILFGIADSTDGRVDKYKHPAPYDNQFGNPNPPISGIGKQMLTEPTGRFRPAGNLIWIDAGTIKENETDMVKALSGSGRLPYDQEEFYLRTQKDLVVPTQVGTLTLKYDPNIRDDAWKYLTVYHFDLYEDYTGVVQWRWRNIGGVVDRSKNTITVPLETFGYYQVMYMYNSFNDVTGHPWARDELDALYSKGYMLNQEDSNFVPNAPITRGEFATMLVKIYDLPLQYTNVPTFSDVVPGGNFLTRLYDYKYIETAARAGIIRGTAERRFRPGDAITRQDAAVMIARAADLKVNSDSSDPKLLANLRKMFTDADQIDIYARASVEAVTKAGLIEGIENTLAQGQTKATVRFDPLQTFTRAEAATVAMRVLRSEGKVPK
jgi:hypothetical protein